MDTLLAAAKHAAFEAGKAIMELYEDGSYDLKSNNTPVTLADTAAHNIITSILGATSIQILSEESEGIALPYPETLWVIDPMDGTKGFIHKDGEFSVMIGLLVNGEAVLGVVYLPTENSFYYGVKGQGAFYEKDGVCTKLTVASSKSPLRFLQSRYNTTPYIEHIVHDLSAVSILRGSIGIKAGNVARDEGDFFFTNGPLGEWDVCAPSIIMEEAGGRVTDLDGNRLTYGTENHLIQRGLVFSNASCHDTVLASIKKIEAEHTSFSKLF